MSNLCERIQEHLASLGPAAGDTDTAWLLREAKRDLERLYQGETAVIPKTREHAERLFVVADACINSENYQGTPKEREDV